VLSKDFAEKVKRSVLEHREFRRVTDEILAKIEYDNSVGFALLVGVAGAGKTTVLGWLARHLTEYISRNQELDCNPPIVLNMSAPERKVFSWTDFYQESLTKGLQVPFVENRKDLEAMLMHFMREGSKKRIFGKTIADLRRAFIDATNSRRPIALLIDEIHEMCKVTGTEKAHDNLDVLKSLSDALDCSVIAAGTSRAYKMLYINEQVTRRADMIRLPRYTSCDEDVIEFRDLIYHIEHTLNVPFSSDVSGDVTYFYNRTLGCVGVLMDWVQKSMSLAARRGGRRILRSDLDRKAQDGNQLRTLACAIRETDDLLEEARQFDIVEELRETPIRLGSKKQGQPKSTGRIPGKRKPGLDKAGQLSEEMQAEIG
jgi:hypothetical protein